MLPETNGGEKMRYLEKKNVHLFQITKMGRGALTIFLRGYIHDFHRSVRRPKNYFLIPKTILSYVFFGVECNGHLIFRVTVSKSREMHG